MNISSPYELLDLDAYFIYSAPLIVIIGLTGNTLSLLVFSRRCFRKNCTASYLKALAIVDMIALSQFMTYYFLYKDNWDLKQYSSLTCKFLTLLLFVPPSTSVWLEVFISVDRSVYLTKGQHISFVKRHSYLVWASIVIVNLLIYSPILINTDIRPDWKFDSLTRSFHCRMCRQDLKAWILLVDLLNFSIIPFVIMLVSSIVNVRHIFKSRSRIRRAIQRSSFSQYRHKRDLQFAVTSLSLNFLFLSFNSPITVVNIITNLILDSQLTQILFAVSLNIYFTKLALPFLIYLIVNSKFREEFLKLILLDSCQ
nr:G protein-coupled receptor [Proales similis]